MIHFKNLKQGSSFIEMMVALTLLAIFGSSIFLVQSNIFTKIFKTHQTALINQDVTQELITLKTKIQQTVLQKKEVDVIALHEVKKNPERKIDLTLQKIPASSSLFKTFEKNIRIVQNTITYENNRKATWFTFTYIPVIQKQAKNDTAISTNSAQVTPSATSANATSSGNPTIAAQGVIV